MDNEKELALKKKAQKDYPAFVDAVEGLSTEELKSNLTRYAKYREETELAKKKDEELERAKDLVNELSAPYNDTLKALKIKMAYINILMEELGSVEEGNGQDQEA